MSLVKPTSIGIVLTNQETYGKSGIQTHNHRVLAHLREATLHSELQVPYLTGPPVPLHEVMETVSVPIAPSYNLA